MNYKADKFASITPRRLSLYGTLALMLSKTLKKLLMEKNKLFELNDEELKIEKNNLKKRKIINALLIGFLAGIFFIGSAALVKGKNALGIIPLLIPLFLIYRLVSNSKKDKHLEVLLKERNLN